MNFLEQMMGGGQQQQEYQGFVDRYHQGSPAEGYSDQEVAQRYQQVAPNLDPQQYQQAAQQSFERMPVQDRQQFGQYIQQQAQQQGIQMPSGMNYEDPAHLAQMTTQIHQQQPGMLGQLLGSLGGGGGMGGNAMGGGGMGGAASMLSNPVAKAALAGIAAMAVKNFMGQRH